LNNFTNKQSNFITAALAYSNTNVGIDLNNLTKDKLQSIADSAGMAFPHWITRCSDFKVGRGIFRVPMVDETPADSASILKELQQNVPNKPKKTKVVAPAPVSVDEPAEPVRISEPVVSSYSLAKGVNEYSNIPESVETYVPFGHFKNVNSVIKSKQFYPIFITGLSGNGKTMMVEQACAKAKRDLYRVNITIETDEDDLLGGFRLVNGETVWFDGPVVEAMKSGSVLLLDEVDLGSTKLMCLQPVLEGNGVFLKKINEWVKPADGFNIIATANTKGKGDDTGNFIGTGILNEAFLERFPITIEQSYPSVSNEKKIMYKMFNKFGIDDNDFANKLVDWADLTRKAYAEESVESLITTRRLVHIAQAYSIFNDKMTAIDMCVSRFDDITKEVFLDTYRKIDADVSTGDEELQSETPVDEVVETSTTAPF